MENKHLAVEPSSRESSFDPPSYSLSHGKDYTLQWHPAVGSKELAVALSYHFPLETSMERKMRAATKKFLKEEKRKVERSSGNSGLDTTGLTSVVEESAEGTTSGQLPSKESLPELPIEPNSTELWVNYQVLSSSPDTVMKPEPAHLRENTRSEIAEPTVPYPSPEEISPKILSWVHGVDSKEAKRRKRRYGMIEALEVAANRGNACDDHRKRKVKCLPESCPNNGLWLRTNAVNTQAKPSLLTQVLRKLTPDANPKALDTSARETIRPKGAFLSKPLQQSQSNAVQLSSKSASDDVHSEKVNPLPESTKSKPRTVHSGQSQSNVTNDDGTSTTTFGNAHEASIQHPVFLSTAHTSGLHSEFVDTSWPPVPTLSNDFMAYHVNGVESPDELNETSPWFLEEANVLDDWDVASFMPEGLKGFTGPADQGKLLSLEDIESVLNAPVGRHQFSTIPDPTQSPIFVDYPLLSEVQRLRVYDGDFTVSTRNLFTPPIEEYNLPDTEGPAAPENGHTEVKSKDSVSTRLKNMISSPRKRMTAKHSARRTMSPNPGTAGSPLFMETCQQISTSANSGLNASQLQSWREAVNVSRHQQTPEPYFPRYELEIASELSGFGLSDTKCNEI